MNSNIYKRQTDLITPNQLQFPITIIGAGGIGSWAALALAKMGALSLTVVDFDKIEIHNTASQIYGADDVGRSKVDALQEIVNRFTHRAVTPIPFVGTAAEYAASGLPFGRVVISAVDSLEARKGIWEIISPMLGSVDLYMDCRMGGEQLRIICVSPYNADSVLKYQKKMDAPVTADPTPCTARAVSYNTFMIGGMVASLVKRYAKREPIGFDHMWDVARLEKVGQKEVSI